MFMIYRQLRKRNCANWGNMEIKCIFVLENQRIRKMEYM